MQPHKSRIRGGNMNVGDIPMFDLEKDISEEHSADMNAAKEKHVTHDRWACTSSACACGRNAKLSCEPDGGNHF